MAVRPLLSWRPFVMPARASGASMHMATGRRPCAVSNCEERQPWPSRGKLLRQGAAMEISSRREPAGLRWHHSLGLGTSGRSLIFRVSESDAGIRVRDGASFRVRVSSMVGGGGERLVLYSKPGCCLCDALKEKLEAVLYLGDKGILEGVQLEIRDITTRVEWEQAYQYEIPVMTRLTEAGNEVPIPRQSPRVTVDRLKKQLQAAFS